MSLIRLVFLVVLAAALASGSALAKALRPAPDFGWMGARNVSALKKVRGQPVVLLIAPSARSGAFKKQLKNLREIYQQFASREVVFVAALQDGGASVPSNIPFAIAENPPAVAAAYGVPDGKFALVIIGKDGNLDYLSTKPRTAQRIRDVIQNSFAIQEPARKP
jgi:peroxiredoxin